MQPRVEALVGLGVLAVLVLMAGALGQRENRAPSADPRASSLLTGPLGARALADGLTRLGVEVRRQRRPLRRLAAERGSDSATALLLLDPLNQVRGTAAMAVLDWSRGPGRRDLLLAGPGAAG